MLIPRGTDPHLLGDALVERGGLRVGAERELWFDTEGIDLPGGAVRVLAVHLDMPAELNPATS